LNQQWLDALKSLILRKNLKKKNRKKMKKPSITCPQKMKRRVMTLIVTRKPRGIPTLENVSANCICIPHIAISDCQRRFDQREREDGRHLLSSFYNNTQLTQFSYFHHSVAKQAKALEAKLRIAQGEDEEDSEDEDDDDDDKANKKAGWGANRRSYYDADVADIVASEDEEDLQEEEKEALRLQREAAADLRPEDYKAISSDEDEEEEETMGAAAAAKGAGGKKKKTTATKSHASRAIETLTRDPLSQEALEEAVERDALELEALVSQLRSSLNEVRNRLAPILAEVREGGLATEEGVSYLEAKHMLLLSYVGAIVFYLLLKAEGKPVAGHPVVTRLVELRAYLEKIRPIDKRLHYQVEKLLSAATMAQGQGGEGEGDEDGGGDMGGVDEQQLHGPNPEALLASGFADIIRRAVGGGVGGVDGDEDIPTDVMMNGGGVYRPPRVNPISMETEEGYTSKDKRKMDALQRRAARSGFVQQLGRELAGAPEEQKYNAYVTGGMDTAAAIRERQRLAAREEVEEELMIRVPLSKEERKRLQAQKRAGLSGKALLDDFADDVADIVAAAEANNNNRKGGGAGSGGGGKGVAAAAAGAALADPMLSRHRTSQTFGADLYAQAAAKKSVRSGDDDLPMKEPLHERRAKMDGVRAKKTTLLHNNADGDDDGVPMGTDFGGGGGGGRKRRGGGEEDDFYKEVAEAAAKKKSKKKDTYSYPETLAPAPDTQEFGARGITKEIEKNRGLTPHRRKDMKNPRKKHRVKYALAQVRRKGAVQEVRAEGGAVYGGETTGIKSRVTKSVKF
jgi:U3 small nucleolar RNA-associated protein 3